MTYRESYSEITKTYDENNRLVSIKTEEFNGTELNNSIFEHFYYLWLVYIIAGTSIYVDSNREFCLSDKTYYKIRPTFIGWIIILSVTIGISTVIIKGLNT